MDSFPLVPLATNGDRSAMPKQNPDLTALRRAIDAVDDRLHALVERRGTLVARVAAAKTGARNAVYRPAREAQIMRRLAARHGDAREADRVLRIWRAIFAASCERQGGFKVLADPAVAGLARDHFGTRGVRVVAAAGALRRVLQGRAEVAVLPFPEHVRPGWLSTLIAARRLGVSAGIVAGLPFLRLATRSRRAALIVGRGHAEPSGDDITFIAAPNGRRLKRAERIFGGKAGEGLSLYRCQGYWKPGDSRLAGAVWLGACPRPLEAGARSTSKNPRS